MNKKIAAIILVFVVSVLFAIPAFSDTGVKHIYDETNSLTAEEIATLEAQAVEAHKTSGIGIYFIMVHDTGDINIAQYADKCHEEYGFATDSLTFVVSDELYYFLPLGKGVDIYPYAEESLWGPFNSAGTNYEGIAAYINNAKAEAQSYYAKEVREELTVTDTNAGKRMVDNADLLDPLVESRISARLDEISNKLQCDVIVVTVPSLYGMSATSYADNYYDFNGYGFGSQYDGILFLVSMSEREWAFSTCGYGIDAFTDEGLEYMEKEIVPSLRSGKYEKAFDKYADLCDLFITQAQTGQPFDSSNLPKTTFSIKWVIWALIVGAIVALVVTLAMKGQLKSVKKKTQATDYVKANSMNVTESRDRFLFSNVTKRARPKNNSGSGTHRSSSGRSHGGRSGRF